MRKILSASLSPNTEVDDVLLAFRMLWTPWLWQRGPAVGKVEAWFRKYFGVTCAVSFNSGRSALLAILKSFGIGKGSEVIVQAFTCVAVPNSVRWSGATPVFADIDDTFNMDPASAEKKISPRTHAIIVQHTFGFPADLDAFVALAKKYHLILIEDCAHALGSVYKGRRVGAFGDASFFSFGRDKVVSSVFGGLASIRADHPSQISALKAYHKKLSLPSFFWIFQQLCHPVAFSVILPLYTSGLGKILLVFLQRIRLLSFPVYREEKAGRQPADFPAKYPDALAALLFRQLKKLDRFTIQRRNNCRLYGSGYAYMRFPKLVEDPASVIAKAKKSGILLGNWYHNVIDPTGVALETIGYRRGSCPKAEDAARHIINLPTRISVRQAQRVLKAL